MNIEATKLELMELLLQSKNEALLAQVKKMFQKEEADWWNEISEEEKTSIKAGLLEADQGKTIPNQQVMKKFEKWG